LYLPTQIGKLPTRRVRVPVWMSRNVALPDYAMDIRRDDHGQFFELRVPAGPRILS
jgi:hypothetical protein